MANGTVSVSPSGGRPELVVVAKSNAALRAAARGVTSAAPEVDTTSLQRLLAEHNAVMRPLFGLNEDRLRAQARSMAPAAETAPVTETESAAPGHDLSRFYHVAVADLLKRLRSQELRPPHAAH